MTAIDVLYVVQRSARNRLLNALVDELHPDRVRFEVVVFDGPGPISDDMAERRVSMHALGPITMRTLPLGVARIRRLVRRCRGVVHSNGYLPGLAVELARSTMPHPPASVLGRHHNREHHLVAPRHVRLDAWSARHATAVSAVSSAVRETLQDEGVPADRIAITPNGVDWSSLEPSQAAVAAWRDRLGVGPVAVAAGRLDPVKDYPTMLDALVRARREVRELRLAIAGIGDPGSTEALMTEIARRSLEGAVLLLGWVDDLPALLAAADVVVQSSLDESFGQVVLEAMGLGVPVAVTTPGGVRDVVAGWQVDVPPRDADALAAVLVGRLLDPDARRRAADAAIDVRERFASSVMADAHVALYQRVVQAVAS